MRYLFGLLILILLFQVCGDVLEENLDGYENNFYIVGKIVGVDKQKVKILGVIDCGQFIFVEIMIDEEGNFELESYVLGFGIYIL